MWCDIIVLYCLKDKKVYRNHKYHKVENGKDPVSIQASGYLFTKILASSLKGVRWLSGCCLRLLYGSSCGSMNLKSLGLPLSFASFSHYQYVRLQHLPQSNYTKLIDLLAILKENLN